MDWSSVPLMLQAVFIGLCAVCLVLGIMAGQQR